MNRWRTFFACLGMLLLTGCSFDVLMRERTLNLNFKDTTVEVASMTAKSTVELKPYIEARADWKWNVLFVNRRDTSTYLLLAVSGRSDTNEAGVCANGSEENIIWLKLDPALKLLDAKSALIGSCREDIRNSGNYTVTGRELTIACLRNSIDGSGGQLASRRFQFSVHYDNDHPEAGMATESHESAGGDFVLPANSVPMRVSGSGG